MTLNENKKRSRQEFDANQVNENSSSQNLKDPPLKRARISSANNDINKNYEVMESFGYQHKPDGYDSYDRKPFNIQQISDDMLFYGGCSNIIKLTQNKMTIYNIFNNITIENKLAWFQHFNPMTRSDYHPSFSYDVNSKHIGPSKINKIFINERKTEMVMNIQVIMEINKAQNIDIIFKLYNNIPNINDFNKQQIYLGGKQLIGYLQDKLLRINMNEKCEYYDKNKRDWFNCYGIKKAVKSRSSLWCDAFIIKLPTRNDDILNYGVHYDSKFYCYNKKWNQFIETTIFDEENNVEVDLYPNSYDAEKNSHKYVIFNDRCFYIFRRYLYELKWNTANNNNTTLIRCKHLGWIKCGGLYYANKYGICLNRFGTHSYWRPKTIEEKQYEDKSVYLLFYNPDQNIIYRLTNNCIDLIQSKKKYKYIEFGIWSDQQQSFNIVFEDDLVILKKQLLEKLEHDTINNLYDLNQCKYDCSFNIWKSEYFENDRLMIEAFTKCKPHLSDNSDPSSTRAPYVYYCRYQSHCYHLVAGWNCDENKYPQLKYLKSDNFKELEKIEDIADYLGAVIWYQDNSRNQHVIKISTIFDFENDLRSTKELNWEIMFGERGRRSGATHFCLNNLKWIGIIDIRDPKLFEEHSVFGYSDNLLPRKYATHLNVVYDEIWSNKFEVTKGRIITGYLQFGDVAKGEWYWNIKNNQQLLVYHESVKNDEKYINSWEIQKNIYKQYEENEDYDYDSDNDEFADFDIDEYEALYKQTLNKLLELDVCSNDCCILIAKYCYSTKVNLPIQQDIVLKDNWYFCKNVEANNTIDVFDYDKYGDTSHFKDIYKNLNGYDWYSFKEKCNREFKGLWNEMIEQSLSVKNPCSVYNGCVFRTTKKKKKKKKII